MPFIIVKRNTQERYSMSDSVDDRFYMTEEEVVNRLYELQPGFVDDLGIAESFGRI